MKHSYQPRNNDITMLWFLLALGFAGLLYIWQSPQHSTASVEKPVISTSTVPAEVVQVSQQLPGEQTERVFTERLIADDEDGKLEAQMPTRFSLKRTSKDAQYALVFGDEKPRPFRPGQSSMFYTPNKSGKLAVQLLATWKGETRIVDETTYEVSPAAEITVESSIVDM